MRRYKYPFITFWVLCWLAAPVLAQNEDRPVALIRQKPDTTDYLIKVQTNARVPQGHKLSAILSNKSSLVIWKEEVGDCVSDAPDNPCLNRDAAGLVEVLLPLTRKPQTSDKFRVSFAISDDTGRGSFRSIDVTPDIKVGSPRIDSDCKNGLIVDFQLDGALDSNPTAIAYFEARLKELDKWLRASKSTPSTIARVRIEPLTKAGVSEYRVRSFSVAPSVEGSAHRMDLDVERALNSQKVLLCIELDEALPWEKFNAEVAFKTNPLPELEKPLTKSLAGLQSMASPSAAAMSEEKKLGLRSLQNNLDLGFLYTSAVKDSRKNNRPVRERVSRGSLDLRFAPLLRGRTTPPEVKKWQPFWTPIFLDAKLSNGNVTEETLSLNRIIVGTEVALRRIQGTRQGDRDKYVLTLRGTNASDRDYKRAEVKGEFEFRPIFEALNQPLRIRRTSVPAVLVPDSPQKEVLNGNLFGYQIQPFVGVEAGWRYRDKRPAFRGEGRNDFVRRLLLGTDMVFNITPRLTLTLTDTFYLRGEAPGDRKRNYFNAIMEAPLGNLSQNAAQSVFLSFERGSQPPFATAGVNALKFGYRIKSDFFARGPAR